MPENTAAITDEQSPANGSGSNPLLTPSTLPYQLPDFASLRFEHYREGLDVGMAEEVAEIAAITGNPDEPSFENTVLALQVSGRTLGRVLSVFYNILSSDSTDELRELDAEYAPRLSEHYDAISFDPQLFERVKAVHDRLDDLELDAESRQLVERTFQGFVLRGALLDDETKQQVREDNQRTSSLTTTFNNNVLADTNDLAIVVHDVAELDGLSPGEISSARQAAADRGLDDAWVITLLNFSVHPWLARLTNRDLRRRIYEATASKGARDNQWNNAGVVRELTAVRARRAGLMGYANHAAMAMSSQTAGSPEAVEKVVYPLVQPAIANLHAEAARLQAEIDRRQAELGQPTFELAPWDWAFYTELVRAAEYDVDTAALAPWFEAERVLVDGVFWAATQLYGITFTERPDLLGYHPDVRVFEVKDADGTGLALFLFDLYTRPSKRGGAWMNNLVSQSRLYGTRPVICNNLNVARPAPGEPTLLTIDNVTTMFHEFGHALHGIFSDVTYASLSGTAVPRDFVEFPSQVNEMWQMWPEVVEHYARHHETGEPLDPTLLERLRASETFNEGFHTVEYLGAALLDQEWHKIEPGTEIDDVAAFEDAAIERVGLANPWVAPRYRTPYFSHTFGGGYDAGYYGYIWSEVLDADTVEWFRENGGLTRANGDHFRGELLSRGRSREPLDSYRGFRGRDAEITPLLRRRGLLAE